MSRRAWCATTLLVLAACSSTQTGASTTSVTTAVTPSTSVVSTSTAVASTTSTTSIPSTSTTVPPGRAVDGSTPKGDAAFIGAAGRVQVGSVQIGYRRFGAGDDLVLIAGEGSGMDTWPVTFLSALAGRFRVTMFDGRELGYTTFTQTDFTLEDLADDTAGLIDVLGLHHPVVFGWSTGGEIGLLLAARHPESLSNLVISGAEGGKGRSVSAAPAVEACASSDQPTCDLLHMLFSRDAAGDAAAARFVADYLKVPHPPAAPDMMRRYVAAERQYLWHTVVPYDAIRVPVLVCNGDADELVPARNAELIAAALGDRATLHIVPGGAHGWFLQDTAAFMRLLAESGIGTLS